MLIQSHSGQIELLPALPREWATGSVTGLKARGGFVVDMKWADGKLTEAVIHSLAGQLGVVRYRDSRKVLNLEKGEQVSMAF